MHNIYPDNVYEIDLCMHFVAICCVMALAYSFKSSHSLKYLNFVISSPCSLIVSSISFVSCAQHKAEVSLVLLYVLKFSQNAYKERIEKLGLFGIQTRLLNLHRNTA